MTFKVVYMNWALDQFRDLFDRAKSKALGSEVLEKGKELDKELRDDPLRFGDPTYSLPHLKLQYYIRTIGPLVVHYAVHQTERLLHAILDREASPRQLRPHLERLESERPVQCPLDRHHVRRLGRHPAQVNLSPAVATLDQLAPEQRAIIELVVQRQRLYDELGGMLDLPSSRVRELARDALVELAPVTARRVDPDRLGQLADYVLDQQSGAEQTATQAHLRRSEAGRAWMSSLLDSLGHMYDGGPPEIPEAEAEAPPRRRERERPKERERVRERPRVREPLRRPEPEKEPRRRPAALSPEALAAVRRRRIIGGLIGILAIAGIVVGILAITGGGSSKKTKSSAAAQRQPRILGELLLRPVNGKSGGNQGIAIVAQRGAERDLIVQAKLPPTKQGQAYEVWLYNSKTNAVPVGAQVTDQQGNYQGAGRLPADLSKFQAIDVSLQTIPDQACQRNPACLKRTSAHSGASVLRGLIADMRAPGRSGTATPGGQTTAPGTTTGP